MIPEKLSRKLALRQLGNSLRSLQVRDGLIDFASNDYLGFSKLIQPNTTVLQGATGSRLLTGNSSIHEQAERQIADFHQSENALLFNSGYDANVGLISSIALRGDLILYDEFVHASLRDGIQLSMARSLKYRHNDLEHLRILLDKFGDANGQQVYVITESVFSMDGDRAPLRKIIDLIQEMPHIHLILDEAHALGVIGEKGAGLAQELDLQDQILARVVTYGKAMGCHGAAVLGSDELKEYLINFARSFIYTTAISPHAVSCIQSAYALLSSHHRSLQQLQHVIERFNRLVIQNGLRLRFRESDTAIQIYDIPGNQQARHTASVLQNNGFDVRAILSPTVPEGKERLRICLHSFNTEEQLVNLLQLISKALPRR